MFPQNTASVVITDASVIINLCYTGHILLLGRTTTFEFVVTDEVIAEITEADQQRALAEALAAGALRRESISSPEELTTFAELKQILVPAKQRAWRWPKVASGSSLVTKREFFFGRLESVSARIGYSTPWASMSIGYGRAF